MSINQLIQNKEKPWLNVRVNDIIVDGSSNIPGADHYNSVNNSFQATNQTTERPGESINIGGVVDDTNTDSNSVVLLGSTIGTRNIAIGTVSNVGNEVIALGTNLSTDGDKNIVLAHDLSLDDHDNLVIIGNDLNMSGIGTNSVVVGDGNIVRNTSNLANQIVIGNSNQLGGSGSTLSNKNTVIGSGNIVNTTVASNVDEETVCVGSSNNFNNCKNMVILGDDNNSSGAYRDGICVGKGLTVGADGEMRIGSGATSSVKILNLRNSSSGDAVKYDSVSKELVYDTSGGGGGMNYSAGSLTITGTGDVVVGSLTFEPKKINFYYVYDVVNYANVRLGTGTANSTFTYYETWSEGMSLNFPSTGVGSIPGGTVITVSDSITNTLVINILSINSDGFRINTANFTGWASGNPVIRYECLG